MPSRNEVFWTITEERRYQNTIWGDTLKDMSDWLVYLNGYYLDIVHLTPGRSKDSKEILHTIRKMAALCVGCIESVGGWDQNNVGAFVAAYPGPVPRSTVYHMIERVRDYHTEKRGERFECYHGTINGYILVLGRLLQKAIDTHLMAGARGASQLVLAMAGVAVHCMEDHGAPRRVL